MSKELSSEWDAWQILHDGDGPRGEYVLVMDGFICAATAACRAADYFHEQEAREQDFSDDDIGQFHKTSQVVEVRQGHNKETNTVQRFDVCCQVVRQYTAFAVEKPLERIET